MKRKHLSRGSALMLVVIAALLLIVLTGAAYTYIKSSGSTYQWSRERIQAKLTAESGAHLAIHMILGGADIPQGKLPEWFLGGEGTWFDLPAPLGQVKVSVDPNEMNDQIITANAYEVRSLGKVAGVEGSTFFGFAAGIMPENIARFSVFQHNPGDNVYIGDGFVFDGPYYANGPVRIYSESAMSNTDDPFFYSFTTTADHYLYGTNATLDPPHVDTPQYGNLEIRPINRHLMGEPWFNLNADPIPYGSDELNWESARNAALSGGIHLQFPDIGDGTRIVLHKDTVMVQPFAGAPVQYFRIGEYANPVVWIDLPENDNTVYIKGSSSTNASGLSRALTVGTNGNLAVAGTILYQDGNPQNPDNDVLLGLLAVYGHTLIAHPNTDNTGWDTRFAVATQGDLEVDAVMVSLDGNFQAEMQLPEKPEPRCNMFLLGGFMYQRKGPTAYNNGYKWMGHDVQIYFDPRLMTMHPPYFPNNGRWHTLFWEARPDMDERLMMANTY